MSHYEHLSSLDGQFSASMLKTRAGRFAGRPDTGRTHGADEIPIVALLKLRLPRRILSAGRVLSFMSAVELE